MVVVVVVFLKKKKKTKKIFSEAANHPITIFHLIMN